MLMLILTQNSLIPRGKHEHLGHADFYGQNDSVFVSESRDLCSSLAITIRETSTVKDLSKLQIQKSLFKKPVVVSKANQRVT